MLMQFADCCDKPFPDCFGCPVLETDIPTIWQMDFASPMTYSAGSTGSCSFISTPDPSPFYPKYRTTVNHQFEYPDLSDFGNATLLEIDDAEILNPLYAPWTQCIWASGDFEFYLRSSVSTKFCVPSAFRNTPYSGANAWSYYYQSAGITTAVTPPAYSANRIRSSHVLNDILCDTVLSGCAAPGTSTAHGIVPAGSNIISCNIGVKGVYALLQIVQRHGQLFFKVDVIWFPARYTDFVNEVKQSVPFDWYVDDGAAYWIEQFVAITTPSGTMPCPTSAYTAATSAVNISQGLLLSYEKQIDCEADFDGSPVLLALVNEYSASGSATQTICEAAGITNIPATITLTPA